MKILISKPRKDNRFPVRYYFEGSENMFGGRDVPKIFNKLKTLEQIKENIKPYTEVINESGLDDNIFRP